jgi:hypothetical protein
MPDSFFTFFGGIFVKFVPGRVCSTSSTFPDAISFACSALIRVRSERNSSSRRCSHASSSTIPGRKTCCGLDCRRARRTS